MKTILFFSDWTWREKRYQESAEAYLKVVQVFGVATTEDFVEAARTLSLAKRNEAWTKPFFTQSHCPWMGGV